MLPASGVRWVWYRFNPSFRFCCFHESIGPCPRRVLPTIIFAQFACTSLWFVGNAVLPDCAALRWQASIR